MIHKRPTKFFTRRINDLKTTLDHIQYDLKQTTNFLFCITHSIQMCIGTTYIPIHIQGQKPKWQFSKVTNLCNSLSTCLSSYRT